ncbi:unnamed protein product [Anisakis simplex]|uniref:DUF148 domain-containing protein n=1 Tax=Anisakis simplex TaxID=6269 RepID=A0A0M3K6I8_ANISI|nr:unnamed protein product [Anisakis simplex]
MTKICLIFNVAIFVLLLDAIQCECDIETGMRYESKHLCELLQNTTDQIREEFNEIFANAANLTKEQLNDNIVSWATKYGGSFERELRQYLADEADYWNRRYETLVKRIQEANATAEAKKELLEVIEFEQDMDTKFSEYETKLEQISQKYSQATHDEAVKIWTQIDTFDTE